MQQNNTSLGKHFRQVFSGSVGNLIEWYDWYVYSIFALYFADAFFPKQDQTAQLFNTAGIFAIGFLMRPIGGWIMGVYADRKGRKAALTLSILLMSGGSLIITCVPGYSSIGIAAPVILVLARMLQGVSVGGEYGAAATYLSEVAPKNRRGLYSSFQYVTTIIGQLIALGILLLLQQVLLTPEQLMSWGWRIPFGIGALLALSAVYLRRSMPESEAFSTEKTTIKKRGSLKELYKYRKESLVIAGFTMGLTVTYYTLTTYVQKFLVNTAGFSKSDSTLIMIITLVIFMLAQPVAGVLGDVMNRKRLMIIAVALSILTVPAMMLLANTHSFIAATTIITIALIILSLNTAISAIVKAELFPVNVRSLGVGFPYAITVAIFGGTAEPIALGFKKAGHPEGFYWYLAVLIAISLFTVIVMPDAQKQSTLDKKGA
jgi:MHS family alpha-ketoglutarate permease-like MFS transporter